MATKKYYVNYVTLAASAGPQQFTFVTPDDPVARTVTEVHCSVQVATLELDLLVVGQVEAAFDTTRFAAGNEPVDLNITLPATLPLTIQFVDRTAAGRTNVAVTLGYETQ